MSGEHEVCDNCYDDMCEKCRPIEFADTLREVYKKDYYVLTFNVTKTWVPPHGLYDLVHSPGGIYVTNRFIERSEHFFKTPEEALEFCHQLERRIYDYKLESTGNQIY